MNVSELKQAVITKNVIAFSYNGSDYLLYILDQCDSLCRESSTISAVKMMYAEKCLKKIFLTGKSFLRLLTLLIEVLKRQEICCL